MRLRQLLVNLIVVAVVAAAALFPALSTGAKPAAELLDLPAMALTPSDIEALGLEGFGRFGNGEFRDFGDYVDRRAGFLNKPVAEVTAALKEAGWTAGYVSNLGLPSEPGNPESRSAQIVFTSIYQYADAKGAEAGYDYNRQYDGVEVDQFEVLPGTRPIGDTSYLTHTIFPEGGNDRPSNQLDLSLRHGNIVAATGLIVFTDLDKTERLSAASDENVALIEALGARLIERIDAVLAGDSPNLSTRIVRFDASSSDSGFVSEGYRRLNGDDPPYYGGYEDDFPAGSPAYAYTVAVYELNQGLALPGDPYYIVRILQFHQPGAASGYLAEVGDRGQNPFGAPATVAEEAASFGDESVTLGWEVEPEPGLTILGYAVYARVAETVVMILLESAAAAPALGDVESLVESQIACLGGNCPASVPIPKSLFVE